jgi:non-ribosomal peptide synthetase component F
VAGAAYVPVDADEPDERAETVWAEAQVCAVIGEGLVVATIPGVQRLGHSPQPHPDDDAWIIFTSGSTGKPKGVAIRHRSAAAWADAEAEMFLREHPLTRGDRVLAGLSVAFDASCEEMWLAWRNGACLVPAPRSLVRSGADLGPWLAERSVTVVSTVPTLAALWPKEALADIRLLIFGGEACPAELVARLAGPEREVWNTYGPTEATVIACGAALDGSGPVRIGLPLRGWDLAVVDPEGHPVAWGEEGELIIGGVGLGRYLDPAKDAEKYAPMPTLGWSEPTAAATWSARIRRACSSWAAPTSRSSSAAGGWSWAKSTRRWHGWMAWPRPPRRCRPRPAGTRCWPATWSPTTAPNWTCRPAGSGSPKSCLRSWCRPSAWCRSCR